MGSLAKKDTDSACYLTDKMRKIFIGFAFFALLSCSKDAAVEIPQDKMVDVLYDLTVSSSAHSISNKRDTLQYVVSYKSILKKHGLDSVKFVKAQKVYQENPELYAVIYDSVQKRIQKKLEAVRATQPDKEDEMTNPVINLKEKIPFAGLKKG